MEQLPLAECATMGLPTRLPCQTPLGCFGLVLALPYLGLTANYASVEDTNTRIRQADRVIIAIQLYDCPATRG